MARRSTGVGRTRQEIHTRTAWVVGEEGGLSEASPSGTIDGWRLADAASAATAFDQALPGDAVVLATWPWRDGLAAARPPLDTLTDRRRARPAIDESVERVRELRALSTDHPCVPVVAAVDARAEAALSPCILRLAGRGWLEICRRPLAALERLPADWLSLPGVGAHSFGIHLETRSDLGVAALGELLSHPGGGPRQSAVAQLLGSEPSGIAHGCKRHLGLSWTELRTRRRLALFLLFVAEGQSQAAASERLGMEARRAREPLDERLAGWRARFVERGPSPELSAALRGLLDPRRR